MRRIKESVVASTGSQFPGGQPAAGNGFTLFFTKRTMFSDAMDIVDDDAHRQRKGEELITFRVKPTSHITRRCDNRDRNGERRYERAPRVSEKK